MNSSPERSLSGREAAIHVATGVGVSVIAMTVGVALAGDGGGAVANRILSPIPGTVGVAALLQYYAAYVGAGSVAAGVTFAAYMSVGGTIQEPNYRRLLRDEPRFALAFPGLAAAIGAAEEGVFRWIPLIVAGILALPPVWTVGVGTVIWVAVHERVQWPTTAFAGLLFAQLWLVGLGLEAVVIHAAHNVVAAVVEALLQKRDRDR